MLSLCWKNKFPFNYYVVNQKWAELETDTMYFVSFFVDLFTPKPLEIKL